MTIHPPTVSAGADRDHAHHDQSLKKKNVNGIGIPEKKDQVEVRSSPCIVAAVVRDLRVYDLVGIGFGLLMVIGGA